MIENKIIDISTKPLHMRMDYQRRNENVVKGLDLCERCDGTGNELYSMYKKCSQCSGTGIQKMKE